MTDSEWEKSCSPESMLSWLGERAGHRKLRLFASACCRRIPELTESDRQLLEFTERYADKRGVSKKQLRELRHRRFSTLHAIYSEQWDLIQAVTYASAIKTEAPHGWYEFEEAASAARHAAFVRLPREKRLHHDQFVSDPLWR